MTTELIDALRKKYPDGRSALRALGVDENLLSADEDLLRKHPQKVIDRLLKMFGSTEKALAKLGMDQSMLTEGEDDFTVPEGTEGVARKVEEMPPQRMSAEDDEEWNDEPLRNHLREQGMSEDQIEKACELARDHARDMRRRGANGHDRHASRDEFPKNAVSSSERPAPSRGHFAGPRGPNEMPSDNYAKIIAHGLDYSPNRQAVDGIHHQLKRFGPEIGYAPERDRGIRAKVPTMARKAKTEARFPGLARIQGV